MCRKAHKCKSDLLKASILLICNGVMLKFIFMSSTVHHLEQILPMFYVEVPVISLRGMSLVQETMLESEAIAEKPSILFYFVAN